jgi:DNA-binding MarR family transcriptional regulator
VDHGAAVCAAYGALTDQVTAFAGVLTAVGNELARPGGQSLARFQVLAAVADVPSPVGVVASKLGHSRQGVQKIADSLVLDGLSQWEDNPAHRKAKLLKITPTGQRAWQDFQEAQEACTRRTIDGLSVADLDAARVLLEDLQRRLRAARDWASQDLPVPTHP